MVSVFLQYEASYLYVRWKSGVINARPIVEWLSVTLYLAKQGETTSDITKQSRLAGRKLRVNSSQCLSPGSGWDNFVNVCSAMWYLFNSGVK